MLFVREPFFRAVFALCPPVAFVFTLSVMQFADEVTIHLRKPPREISFVKPS
ncbi:hypothetical protein HMPREF9413_1490 [Paenibacillus sp. HGF7]|nr:hypothetical protein HMPREF9413_1490 [Paenibacillus sp. HGF7]